MAASRRHHWILGLRPEAGGLRIDPAIPADWPGFRVTRKFRNAWYNIEVKNPDRVSQGVKSVLVDGQALTSVVVPAFADGQTHAVEVLLG
jgi:cellobiose phosphorylase